MLRSRYSTKLITKKHGDSKQRGFPGEVNVILWSACQKHKCNCMEGNSKESPKSQIFGDRGGRVPVGEAINNQYAIKLLGEINSPRVPFPPQALSGRRSRHTARPSELCA